MIKNLLRGFSALALALALVPLTAPAPAQAAEVTTLADAVGLLPVVAEDRTGYARTSFKHWNSGEVLTDGCSTRNEVLIAEAVVVPTVGAGCRLTGGTWVSYYDGQEVSDPGALDIDHMVPLAEAWDSGASAWTAARREAYANDQKAATSLVAVTARTNRSKADQDPAEWLPPAAEGHCRYVGEWVATKLRWQLGADSAELEALKVFAEGPCEDTVVQYTPAP
ncbi:HNH endonuclease family protein [Streptomyces sp. NBC_01142]|uniref:HNH endonuclease family protein n=1 Tax=Streptomyces sp. NBC_01142 TaxID=2975865 RepID=UPI0022542FD3|nr:HNH endonuclease family protein [Streptomyces sp. NBC_01142]MCX4826011.1 HNH endonuclease family protein [Streptomyces sp. NBC_01142]